MKTLKRACYKIQPQVRKTFADNRNIKVNLRVVYINGGIIKAEIILYIKDISGLWKF